MYELPISVIAEDKEYNIRNKGDYRMVLDCFEALDDQELTPQERLYCGLIIFYEDFNDIDDLFECECLDKLVDGMFDFFNVGEVPDPRSSNKPKLVDWKEDSVLIISAVNNVAGRELRAEQYVHWWTFIGYYMAIGECSLSTVVGIRDKIAKGKKLEKYELQFRRDNPRYFEIDLRTSEQKANDEWALSVWNRG